MFLSWLLTKYKQLSDFQVCLAAFVKADADADAQLLYGAYGYGGYAAAPYAYGAYPYAGAYAAGYGVTNAANTVGIAGVAPAALPAVAGGYAGAGRYVANSAGVVHVAKRSADAEPEADAYYGAYGLGYGYGGLYGGYGVRAYGAYPYAYGAYYGKRSADAEPKADADAFYGAYGLGYGYGGYGLGYAGYAGLGYAGYAAPYAYGAYYGKRSADAEPKADAYYGAYGLGYGYGGLYGGYGYRAYGAYPYAYGVYGK